MVTKVVNKRYHVATANDVYIGRPSKWGNPFSHIGTKTLAKVSVVNREEAITEYRKWLMQQPHLLKDLHELKGKTLVCWCKPQSCHGDTLAELADLF